MYTFEELHRLEDLLQRCVTKYLKPILPDVVVHITIGDMPNRANLKVLDEFTPPFHVPLIYDTYRVQGETIVIHCMNVPEEVALLALDNGIYSYPRFILKSLFGQLNRGRCQNFEQFVERIESIAKRPLAVMLHGSSVQFAEQIFETLQFEKTDDQFDQVYLFDLLDSISTMDYEGAATLAKILFIHTEHLTHINFHVKLQTPFPLSATRQVRKMLEIAKNKLFVIADNQYIYGIGELKHVCPQLINECFFINFVGRNTYKATKLYMPKNDTKTQELLIFLSSHKKMSLQPSNYRKDELEYAIHTTFHQYFAQDGRHYQHKIDALSQTIEYATHQRLGTMVVVAPPLLAKREVRRLSKAHQALVIEPIAIEKSALPGKLLIEQLTNIDGAIYVDAENTCHAIGVILDGVVTSKTAGKSERGARYNAAVKYFSRSAIEKQCLIAIISEDGMIDLLFPQNGKDVKQYLSNIHVAFSRQHYEEVIYATSQLLMQYAHYYPFYLYRGIASYYLGYYAEAKMDLVKASTFQQNEAIIFYWLGVVKRTVGDYEPALKHFTIALSLEPHNETFYLERALTYIALENFEAAHHNLDEAQSLNELNPLLHYYRGYLYEQQQRTYKALSYYEKAITSDHKQPAFHLARGRMYVKMNKYYTAMQEINKALRLQPLDKALYRRVGQLLTMEGFENYFHEHLQDSKHYALYIVAGYRDMQRGRFDSALNYFEYALPMIRKTSFVYEWTGDCYYELNDLKNAYHLYSTALRINEHDVTVLQKRAQVSLALGEVNRATHDLETAFAYTNHKQTKTSITQFLEKKNL